uniref:aftiphilin-like n=1 Tax=Styela clava TaxID=7725 RepID=UPI0019397612|nr:aftiphilin-like [Styela clava]
MSGFIPMVSTTPPPMDDGEDFGDFKDSAQNDDDFDDFSSPIIYDDDSYPSINSPPSIDDSNHFLSDDTHFPAKNLFPNSKGENGKIELNNDKEVETIFRESQYEQEKNMVNSSMQSSPPLNGSSKSNITDDTIETQCNGVKNPDIEDDSINTQSSNDKEKANTKCAELTDDRLNIQDTSITNSDDQNLSNTSASNTIANSPEPDMSIKDEDISLSQNNMKNSDLVDNFDNGDHVSLTDESCLNNQKYVVSETVDDINITEIASKQSAISEENFFREKSSKYPEDLQNKSPNDNLTEVEVKSSDDVVCEDTICQEFNVNNSVSINEHIDVNESASAIAQSEVRENSCEENRIEENAPENDDFDEDFADFTSVESEKPINSELEDVSDGDNKELQLEGNLNDDIVYEDTISQELVVNNFVSNKEHIDVNELASAIAQNEVQENPCEKNRTGENTPENEDFDQDFADFASVEVEKPINSELEDVSDGDNKELQIEENSTISAQPADTIDKIPVENSKEQTDDLGATFESASTCTENKSSDENVTENIQADDDFGDFETEFVTSDSNCKNVVELTQSEVVPFECDFGAFEENTTANNTDGFADFSAPKETTKMDPDVDDFGDFAEGTGDNDFADFGSDSATTWSSVQDTVKNVSTVKEKVESFVSKYLNKKNDLSKSQIHLISDLMNSDAENHSTVSGESLQISCSGELWDQLEDIDNTLALNFVWNGSGHNKHLLDSLGMHTQNILFSGTKQAYYVPTYYAAGLGMIDPSKGVLKPMSAAEKITALSPTEKNAPALLEEASKAQEVHSEWKTIADNSGSGNSMLIDGSWSHSDEITNNSDTVQSSVDMSDPIPIISSSMDLDYFEKLSVDGSKSSVKSDLIDPELLELTTAPTTEPPPPPKDSGSATLSKILASIKSSSNNSSPSSTISTLFAQQNASKWEEEESKLSPETRLVLQKLPDLSYMKSRTLVFPISTSRVNMDDDI